VVIGDKKSRPCLLTKKEGKMKRCLILPLFMAYFVMLGDIYTWIVE
jgi:hypothetical protein